MSLMLIIKTDQNVSEYFQISWKPTIILSQQLKNFLVEYIYQLLGIKYWAYLYYRVWVFFYYYRYHWVSSTIKKFLKRISLKSRKKEFQSWFTLWRHVHPNNINNPRAQLPRQSPRVVNQFKLAISIDEDARRHGVDSNA